METCLLSDDSIPSSCTLFHSQDQKLMCFLVNCSLMIYFHVLVESWPEFSSSLLVYPCYQKMEKSLSSVDSM